MGSGGNVLLVLVIATFMLGGSMAVSGICANVKSVISYSLRRVVLIITSRASTRARNRARAPVLNVVNIFQRDVFLIDISRACIRERSLTSVLCVRKGLVSLGPFTDTFELCTGVRNHIPVRVVVKTFQRKVISCYTFGLYTMERSLTPVLIAEKLSLISRGCRGI